MGKIMHAGIEYGGGTGGGTDVEANPTGTPTDELNTIRIGSDIYEIVGGGSGGSVYNSTNLYSNSGTSVVNITLSDSVDNYDALYFECIRIADNRSYIVPYYMTTDDLLVNGHFQLFGYSEYASYDVTNSTTFTKVNNNGNWYIKNIYGIKFGSGSGGGQVNYSTTEQVIGTWTDGKPIYEVTYEPATTLHTNGNVWLNTGMVIPDVDKLIDYEVVAKDTNVNVPANIKGAYFRYYNNNVQLYSIGQWYLDILAITVRYTKTTD